MATAYYNETDPFAAAWLRELIRMDLIARGDVDERDIQDIRPRDLDGYTQCHFFAGIGVWSYALREAGWPDGQPVWTGSCPCQPFSAAGKRKGTADERHLWPAFFHLISECRPVTIFGEQVASKDGLAWLDIVSSDLEGEGYAVGAVDTCAAGYGAPHIRQRLYFVANSELRTAKLRRYNLDGASESVEGPRQKREWVRTDIGNGGAIERMADSQRDSQGAGWAAIESPEGVGTTSARSHAEPGRRSYVNGFWGDADWLPCIDGKSRPVEPGTFPLAHGSPHRVGRLRGYGNALVAPQAQAFIEAYLGESV